MTLKSQKLAFKGSIRLLKRDSKKGEIHPRTIFLATTTLYEHKHINKFFKSLKNFHKSIIKQEIKKKINSTLTMSIYEGKESIEDVAKDCAYRKIAHGIPSHPNKNSFRETWCLHLPLLEKYIRSEDSYRRGEEIGDLF